MKVLSRRQLVVLRAVTRTLFDDGVGGPAEAAVSSTLREMGAFLERAGFQTRLAFRAALLVVQLSPLLLMGRMRRFVRLQPAERERCLIRMEGSRLGILLVLIKTFLCLHIFEEPEMVERTGFDGEGLHGPAALPRPGARAERARKLPVLATDGHLVGGA